MVHPRTTLIQSVLHWIKKLAFAIITAAMATTVAWFFWTIGVGCDAAYWGAASDVSYRIYHEKGAQAVRSYADKQPLYCTRQAFNQWADYYADEAKRELIRERIKTSAEQSQQHSPG